MDAGVVVDSPLVSFEQSWNFFRRILVSFDSSSELPYVAQNILQICKGRVVF